ncbi:MAG: hypothetical protein LBB89_10185 [Treponema sp.]|nr:hypothetical protein [Treponema sp.]
MKNLTKLFTTLFGIIAVSAIMVYSFVSCGGGDSGGGGDPPPKIPAAYQNTTWEHPSGAKIEIKTDKVTVTVDGNSTSYDFEKSYNDEITGKPVLVFKTNDNSTGIIYIQGENSIQVILPVLSGKMDGWSKGEGPDPGTEPENPEPGVAYVPLSLRNVKFIHADGDKVEFTDRSIIVKPVSGQSRTYAYKNAAKIPDSDGFFSSGPYFVKFKLEFEVDSESSSNNYILCRVYRNESNLNKLDNAHKLGNNYSFYTDLTDVILGSFNKKERWVWDTELNLTLPSFMRNITLNDSRPAIYSNPTRTEYHSTVTLGTNTITIKKNALYADSAQNNYHEDYLRYNSTQDMYFYGVLYRVIDNQNKDLLNTNSITKISYISSPVVFIFREIASSPNNNKNYLKCVSFDFHYSAPDLYNFISFDNHNTSFLYDSLFEIYKNDYNMVYPSDYLNLRKQFDIPW